MLEAVNRHFFDSTAAERFATLFFGIYDDRTRKLRYVNCAHVSPLILRASGEVDRLDATATMLGAFARWKCKEAQADLRRGDTLVVYSDGVTEAGIEQGEEFGEDRLIDEVRLNEGQSANTLVHKIIDAVSRYSGVARFDDITVVAVRAM